MTVEQATRRTVTKRNGQLAGYTITAVVDGAQMVVRDLAARPYNFLAVHSGEACMKYRGTDDPRRVLSLHETTPRAKDIVAMVRVEAR